MEAYAQKMTTNALKVNQFKGSFQNWSYRIIIRDSITSKITKKEIKIIE